MDIQKTFSAEEINLQKQRVLNFTAFKNSPTLTRFLEFVIFETIHEKSLLIKEYSIAVNVLKRSSAFNPNDDAVVRIHAGRLRRALNEYYLTEGRNDPIIIQVPKGCYVPQFIAAETIAIIPTALPQLTFNPVVAIFPFKTISQAPEINEFAAMLGEQLSAELSRFHDLSVIGYYTTELKAKIEQDILEAAKSINADYIITGNIQFNGKTLHVQVSLLMTITGEVMMTKSFEKEIFSQSFFEVLDEIIQSFIGGLGGYYEIIFRQMAKASPQKVFNNYSVWSGIFSYYKYQRSYTPEDYNNAVATLKQSVKEVPDHAISWAMLGELYLNGMGSGIKNIEDPVSKAYQCILQSIKIDPFCQHGWYALSWVHLFRKEKKACINAARQCIQLNPNNSAMACGAAFLLFCSGCFDEAFPIMERAIKFNPYYPWWINGGYSFYYLYKKEYTSALLWAEKINPEETFWNPLLKSVSFSYLNNKKDAEKYLLKLLEIEPETPKQLPDMISTFILSEELATDIIRGLKKAGLQFPN